VQKLTNEELGRPDLIAYQQVKKLPVVLILDNVRSALNVGSVFRSADAFRIGKIILCGITAQPPHKEVLKTAWAPPLLFHGSMRRTPLPL
jgi:23S rRNA (guanosine2251-2'-O)-methyltransferase